VCSNTRAAECTTLMQPDQHAARHPKTAYYLRQTADRNRPRAPLRKYKRSAGRRSPRAAPHDGGRREQDAPPVEGVASRRAEGGRLNVVRDEVVRQGDDLGEDP